MLRGEPGSIFVLRSDDLGSLDVGSPVFHRRTRVGRVVGYTLDADRDELSVRIFVEAPYQKLVTKTSRFWNASGIDLTVNASGLTLNTQTLASVLAGGLAFESPPSSGNAQAAPENTVFTLYNDRRAALAPPDGPPVPVRMVFDQSVRGLAEGAASSSPTAWTCWASRSAGSARSHCSTTRRGSAFRSKCLPRYIPIASAPFVLRSCRRPRHRVQATPGSCSNWSPTACARSCVPATC